MTPQPATCSAPLAGAFGRNWQTDINRPPSIPRGRLPSPERLLVTELVLLDDCLAGRRALPSVQYFSEMYDFALPLAQPDTEAAAPISTHLTHNLALTISAAPLASTTFTVPVHLSLTQGQFLEILSSPQGQMLNYLPYAQVRAAPAQYPVGYTIWRNDEQPTLEIVQTSREFGRYYDEVIEWLQLTTREMRQATGIGKSTRFYWNTNAARGSTGRRLAQVHALVASLVDRLGPEETRHWFRTGRPSGLDLLAADDVTALTRRAHDVVFERAEGAALLQARDELALQEDELNDEPTHPSELPLILRNKALRRRKTLSDGR
jgi:hypothetical protein